MGQRSNLCCFSVCSSQVLGPIFTKLGGKVDGGPGYKLEGFIFERSRSSRLKVKFVIFFSFPLCMSYLRLCVGVYVCVLFFIATIILLLRRDG